jgi:hypothetical protein
MRWYSKLLVDAWAGWVRYTTGLHDPGRMILDVIRIGVVQEALSFDSE